jgi:hypothetical protein
VEVEGGRVDLLEAGALGVLAVLLGLGDSPFTVAALGQFDLLAVDGHGLGLAVGLGVLAVLTVLAVLAELSKVLVLPVRRLPVLGLAVLAKTTLSVLAVLGKTALPVLAVLGEAALPVLAVLGKVLGVLTLPVLAVLGKVLGVLALPVLGVPVLAVTVLAQVLVVLVVLAGVASIEFPIITSFEVFLVARFEVLLTSIKLLDITSIEVLNIPSLDVLPQVTLLDFTSNEGGDVFGDITSYSNGSTLHIGISEGDLGGDIKSEDGKSQTRDSLNHD